jgi:hypothetical protein
MQLTFRHIALFLMMVYLLIPIAGFAHVAAPDFWVMEIQSINGSPDSPCDHCPCSDEHESHCCDTGFCSCALHSPPVQGVQLRYVPIVVVTRFAESSRKLPQVYLSIVVPPQNRFLEPVSDTIEHYDYTLLPLAVV